VVILGVFVLALIVALVFHIGAPLLLLTVVLLYVVVPLPRAGDHVITRVAALGLFLPVGYNILGTVGYLVGLHVSADVFNASFAAVLTPILLLRIRRNPNLNLPRWSSFDSIVILPVFLILAMVFITVFHTDLSLGDNIIRYIASSSDGTRHLAMFNDHLRYGGNFTLTMDSRTTGGTSGYPTGWHQGFSIIFLSVFTFTSSTPFHYVAYSYFVAAMITLVGTSLWVSLLTLTVSQRISPTQGILFTTFTSTAATMVSLWATVVISFIVGGYVNFYLVVSYFVCAVTIVLWSDMLNVQEVCRATLTVLLLSCGMSATWTIPDVFLAILLIPLGYQLITKQRTQVTWREVTMIAWGGLAAVVTGLTWLYVILIHTSNDAITVQGKAAGTPDLWVVLVLTVLSVLTAFRSDWLTLKVVITTSIVVLAATAGVFWMIAGRTLPYYFDKIMLTILAVIAPIGSLFIMNIFKRRRLATVLAIVLVLPFIGLLEYVMVTLISSEALLPATDKELAIVTEAYQRPFNEGTRQYIEITDFRRSEFYNDMLQAQFVNPGTCYSDITFPLMNQDWDKAHQAARTCYGDDVVFIVP